MAKISDRTGSIEREAVTAFPGLQVCLNVAGKKATTTKTTTKTV